jgi:hypothetical protein
MGTPIRPSPTSPTAGVTSDSDREGDRKSAACRTALPAADPVKRAASVRSGRAPQSGRAAPSLRTWAGTRTTVHQEDSSIRTAAGTTGRAVANCRDVCIACLACRGGQGQAALEPRAVWPDLRRPERCAPGPATMNLPSSSRPRSALADPCRRSSLPAAARCRHQAASGASAVAEAGGTSMGCASRRLWCPDRQPDTVWHVPISSRSPISATNEASR